MLQTIPWKLPGRSQRPEIYDVIHSTAILEQADNLEEQQRHSEVNPFCMFILPGRDLFDSHNSEGGTIQ